MGWRSTIQEQQSSRVGIDGYWRHPVQEYLFQWRRFMVRECQIANRIDTIVRIDDFSIHLIDESYFGCC